MTYNALFFKYGSPAKFTSWDKGWKVVESKAPELFNINTDIAMLERFFSVTLDNLELKQVELIIKNG